MQHLGTMGLHSAFCQCLRIHAHDPKHICMPHAHLTGCPFGQSCQAPERPKVAIGQGKHMSLFCITQLQPVVKRFAVGLISILFAPQQNVPENAFVSSVKIQSWQKGRPTAVHFPQVQLQHLVKSLPDAAGNSRLIYLPFCICL